MRILLHIGLPGCGAERLQSVLDDKRGQLANRGVLFPRAGGGKNHTRLYMAVSDPDAVDILRYNRGVADRGAQTRLRTNLAKDLAREVEQADAQTLILSCPQLATLPTRSALDRLRALLLPLSEDIRIVAHVDAPGRLLLRHYESAVHDGRTAPLSRDLSLPGGPGLAGRRAGVLGRPRPGPPCLPRGAGPALLDRPARAGRHVGRRLRPRQPDPARLRPGPVRLGQGGGRTARGLRDRGQDRQGRSGPPARPAIRRDAGPLPRDERGLREAAGHRPQHSPAVVAPDAGLGRHRRPPTDPAGLDSLTRRFAAGLQGLASDHPALDPALFATDPDAPDWTEADPKNGFRATQYAAAFLPAIDEATKRATAPAAKPAGAKGLSPVAEKLLTDRAKENFANLAGRVSRRTTAWAA